LNRVRRSGITPRTRHNDPFRARDGKVFTTRFFRWNSGGNPTGRRFLSRRRSTRATVMHERTRWMKNFTCTLKAAAAMTRAVPPRCRWWKAMTALVLVDHALRHKAQYG